jgi:hypothetical protein
VYLDRGLADSAEGFLTGDPARTRLYESGDYKPTFGLVFCTRGQAVAWKHAHADLEQLLTVPG